MRVNMRDTGITMESDAMAGLSALRYAMHTLDDSGRISRKTARTFSQALNGTRSDLALMVALDPERYIGPFASLTPGARAAIVGAIADDDRWRMRGYGMGDWHIALAQLFTKLRWRLADHGLDRTSQIAEILALFLRSGPSLLLHALYKSHLSWRGRVSLRPGMPSLLSMLGIDPRNLAVCYARGVPQSAAYRGFWHDARRHNTYGVVLGLDLLPAAGGFWYIESNLEFGMSRTRAALYGRDPLVTKLVEFAAERGYRNLMILNNTSSYMNGVMARQYQEDAFARKIGLTIVEDAYLPSQSGYLQSHGIPTLDGNDTLVVRTKYYRTSLDYVFQHKHASIRALNVYRQSSPDAALLVPEVSAEPVLGDADSEDPFPNLVYKLPERDEGRGVIFLKARSRAHANALLGDALRRNRPRGFLDRVYSRVEDRNGLYQQYIRSSLLNGRRLYKVRAHVLITPVGVEVLSAHRVISRYAVPEHLPPGIVLDPRPYLLNLSTSQHYEIVPPEEEPLVTASALAVAKGLAWAAAYGFQSAAT